MENNQIEKQLEKIEKAIEEKNEQIKKQIREQKILDIVCIVVFGLSFLLTFIEMIMGATVV